MSNLSAGNAPVAPLVLQGVVGGGSHLPSGDPNARTFFYLVFSIKKPAELVFRSHRDISSLVSAILCISSLRIPSLTPHILRRDGISTAFIYLSFILLL